MVADQVFLRHLPVVHDVNGSYQSVSPPLPPTILPLGATDMDQPPPGFGTPVPSLHRTPSISNETPVPCQSKRYHVPSSDKESKVKIVEPARVLSNTVLVEPVRIFTFL